MTTDTAALVARLREQLRVVHGLIVEASHTGFNYQNGDWATRLYESQGETFKALQAADRLESLSAPAPDGEVEVEVEVEVDDVVRALCDLLEFHARVPIGVAASAEAALGRYYQKYPPNRTRAAIAALPRREGMREALEFYAEPRRYGGANQRELIEGDPHQPASCPYLWDVTRDHGAIAIKALGRK